MCVPENILPSIHEIVDASELPRQCVGIKYMHVPSYRALRTIRVLQVRATWETRVPPGGYLVGSWHGMTVECYVASLSCKGLGVTWGRNSKVLEPGNSVANIYTTQA
jgi:hypothetical protein